MSRHDATPDSLLTVNDLAKRFAISRDSVYRLINQGAIRTVKVGERFRFRPEDVEAYLNRR